MSVIVITARPDQYATAVAAGVGALIEKPLDLPFLLQKMEDLIRVRARAIGAHKWTQSQPFVLPGTEKSRWRSVGSGN